MEDFFSKEQEDYNIKNMPLAAKMAPQSLEDFAGQEAILGKGKMLRRLIEADKVTSAVFFGPPGVGKTGLARFIAKQTKSKVFELNAAAVGVAELKQVLTEAKYRQENKSSSRTLVILDEIHHFNKTQQDVLLPSVESGQIILIGLTTENPYFYINNALLSRFSVFEFKPLKREDLSKILK